MVTVTVEDPKFEIQEIEIKKAVEELVGESQVDVHIVGEETMRELHHKYMKQQGYEEELHDVLSFPTEDPKHLGDIVICYPYARSQNENLIDLAAHGAKHLLGQHHE